MTRQFACADLVEKAAGYGIAGYSVDGTDLEACLNVLENAVGRARNGAGPQMVVATMLRLVGHGEHDDAHYVDSALRIAPVGQDCIGLAERRIVI